MEGDIIDDDVRVHIEGMYNNILNLYINDKEHTYDVTVHGIGVTKTNIFNN